MTRLAALALSAPLVAHASDQAAQVYAQVSDSVCTVLTQTADGRGMQGSAVVVGQGRLITNNHVIAGASQIVVRHGSDQYSAYVVSADPDHDLAVLRAEALAAPTVRFANGDDVKVGQSVYAVGSPRGLEQTLSEGIVSSLRPTQDGALIQTTAAISPGSSGGGLFDDHGRLIGVTTLQAVNGQNLNFAIPVAWLARVGVTVVPSDVAIAPVPSTAAPVPDGRARPLPAVAAIEAAPAPAPAAAAKPVPASPGKGRLFFVTVLILVLLLGAKPAVNWVADAMGNMASMPPPDRRANGGKVAVDRLLPFRKVARDELAGGNRDAATWIKALEENSGDESRAIAAYVEQRAQALYKADLDRKWAAAKAQSSGTIPPRR